LLYSNGASTVTGLATANSGVLVTNATGVPSILGSMTNGQLVVGSVGATPVLATITGTTDQIVVTNGAGTITLSSPQSINTTSTPQFARLGLGVAADATNILTATSASTTNLSKTLNISHTGAITGSGYAGYFSKTGASTTNVGLYTIATGATNNYSLQVDSPAAVAGTYTIYANGAAQNYFAGNIGIGDAAPGTNLSVVGTAQIGYTSGQTVSAGTALAINGNVGIGTTGPTEKLSVVGNGIFGGVSTPYLDFKTTNTAGAGWQYKQIAFKDATDAELYSIGYEYPNLKFTVAGTKAMSINNSGNVGIGTTAPTGKLDVRDGISILSGASIAHGITTFAPTTAYGQFQAAHWTNGGLMIEGFSANASTLGLGLYGFIGSNDPTDTIPAVILYGAKKSSGTSSVALGALETVLQVQNDGTPQLTVLGSGNVGIGTTNPGARLEVKTSASGASLLINNDTTAGRLMITGAGSTYTQADILLQTSDTARGTGTYTYDSAGQVTWYQGTAYDTGSGKWVLNVKPSSATFQPSTAQLGASGVTNAMTVLSGGNVGIGTTNPTTKFQIYGSTGGINGDLITLGGAGYDSMFGMDATGAYLYQTSASRNFSFGSASSRSQLVLKGDGNVGIGTTNPTNKLSIDAGVGTKALTIYGAGNTGNYAAIGFQYSAALPTYGMSEIRSYLVADAVSTDLAFLVGKDNALVEGMRIQSSGNVGIGTTGPAVKLDVHSAANAITADAAANIEAFDTTAQAVGTGGSIAFGGYYSDISNTIMNAAGIKALKSTAVSGEYGFDMGFWTRQNGIGNPTEKMRITSTGNVGIGTTAPYGKLAVSGAS
ncbi:MAG: hypothetical protein NTV03_02005, partial [Candidatus Nomurabacteria bacterium]|nr:hypothetical protein [Candidatus Nomurabacteria bacterium]